jgi:hypothetical protein
MPADVLSRSFVEISAILAVDMTWAQKQENTIYQF